MRKLVILICCAAICRGLIGCVPIPYPHTSSEGYEPDSTVHLPDHVPDFIVKGKTTRDEVQAQLGSPQGTSPDGKLYSYGSLWREKGTNTGVIFVSIVPPMENHTVKLRVRRLLVNFDETGLVSSANFEEQECLRKYVGDSRHWRSTPGTIQPDCLDITGADVVRHVAGEGAMQDFNNIQWRHGVSADGESVGTPSMSENSLTLTERSLRILQVNPPRLEIIPLAEISRITFVAKEYWTMNTERLCAHVLLATRSGIDYYLSVGRDRFDTCSESDSTRALANAIESRRAALDEHTTSP